MDHGAHFYRCDLQVHTPRDLQWSGAECVSDTERRQYAAALIKACREKGVGGIAITDHHDLCFAKYVRDAALEERDAGGSPISPEERIVVFPGLELTLGVPCQALLIFDADLPDDLFSLVLNALAITPNPASASRTAEVTRLEHITTLNELKAELDKHTFLKNRYVILPNVSEGGTDTLLRSGASGKYAAMPCVGGYLDGPESQLGKGNRSIVDGKASQYGHKRIALFQTSDNRRSDHADLGTHSTWVKFAVPTAEALRQACLALESRIAQSQPRLPSISITGLSVSNSVFLGPVQLELNAQYNALIGGRGTGKSTILEYLRWGLCDQLPSALPDDDLPNYQIRRKALIEKTLQSVNATVQVNFVVNGLSHVVRRNSRTGDILLKVGEADFAPCKEADIRALLPIQAYSQKQLSNVSVRLEELSRFVEAPIRNVLDDLDKQFARSAGEMRQLYATVLRMRRLQRQVAKDDILVQSLVEQAANLRSSLKGLGEADTSLLSAKTKYDEAEEGLQIWASDVQSISEAVDQISDTLSVLPTPFPTDTEELPENSILENIQRHISEFTRKAKEQVESLRSLRDSYIDSEGGLVGELGAELSKWQTASAAFSERYDAAKNRASSHETQLQQLADLERRVSELRSSIARDKRELSNLGRPDTKYEEVRAQWLRAKATRSAAIRKECDNLTERSSAEIRATLKVGAGVDGLIAQLRSATSGSSLRREKLDAIGSAVRNADDPETCWLQIVKELELLAAFDAQEGEQNLPRCPQLSSCGLGTADLLRIASKLNEDTWLELSLTRLEDQPEFEYRAREADYIPFANASAGQQATSLLKALLNQPGPPLIIDQPEEDLDNPVILEVVEQIWRAKQDRQLIFASHNANLVVNGDAELVAWCDYRIAGDQSGGHVKAIGAIDVPSICTAIKSVMEGGENAFKLRKEKYGF